MTLGLPCRQGPWRRSDAPVLPLLGSSWGGTAGETGLVATLVGDKCFWTAS